MFHQRCDAGPARGRQSLIALICLAPIAVHAQTINFATTDPEIEMWFYPTSSANGLGSVRDRGSSFATYSYLNENNDVVFYGGDGFDSTRRGTTLIAADTSAVVPRLNPARYRIDSLTMTVTLIGGVGEIVYDNTAEDSLQLTTAGGDDPGNPIELWGVGFDGAYSTFGFGGEAGPEFFNEGDRRWPITAGSFSGPYQLFAIDGEGRDVENAVFGGYSATEPDHVADQFTPSPFAIGRAYDAAGVEATPGATLGPGTLLEFEFDLSSAGVVSYLQNSLAAGHLGVFLSSLHQPLGHTGSVAYPDYFLDNVPGGPNPNGAGPSIALSVTILPPVAGDYDADGDVDGGDLLAWQRTLGAEMTQVGAGADGDESGWIDAGDLDVWTAAFPAANPAHGSSASPVPEPGVACLVAFATLTLVAGAPRRRPRMARRRASHGGESCQRAIS